MHVKLLWCAVKGRISDGQLVSHRQPKLVTGGVLRDYQLDGLDWLKVSHYSTILYCILFLKLLCKTVVTK